MHRRSLTRLAVVGVSLSLPGRRRSGDAVLPVASPDGDHATAGGERSLHPTAGPYRRAIAGAGER
jgi:hypothetical protein